MHLVHLFWVLFVLFRFHYVFCLFSIYNLLRAFIQLCRYYKLSCKQRRQEVGNKNPKSFQLQNSKHETETTITYDDDDGKAQQHFEQSLGKRTEKKEEEEIVLVVCLVISSHV